MDRSISPSRSAAWNTTKHTTIISYRLALNFQQKDAGLPHRHCILQTYINIHKHTYIQTTYITFDIIQRLESQIQKQTNRPRPSICMCVHQQNCRGFPLTDLLSDGVSVVPQTAVRQNKPVFLPLQGHHINISACFKHIIHVFYSYKANILGFEIVLNHHSLLGNTEYLQVL